MFSYGDFSSRKIRGSKTRTADHVEDVSFGVSGKVDKLFEFKALKKGGKVS